MAFTNLITPNFCINCNAISTNLCPKCLKNIKTIEIGSCVVCDQLSIDGNTHRICANKYSPTSYFCTFEYSGLIKKIIINSKNGPRAYKLLDSLIKHKFNSQIIRKISSVDLIVPIPMHENLLNLRIIDHAEYIACNTSRCLNNIPVVKGIKRKPFQAQMKSFGLNDRISKVKSMFLINKEYSQIIKDKNILLVDDLSTSCSTLLECSRLLLLNHAKSVKCYTLAKDIRYN